MNAPNRAVWPCHQWPTRDRQAWERATSPSANFWDDAGRGAALSPATLKLYRSNYGAWLAHLSLSGLLDLGACPAARASPERLMSWVTAMRTHGSKDSTIGISLMALHAALRLMDVDYTAEFILRPGGRSLAEVFPAHPKAFVPLDTGELLRRVAELHANGMAQLPVQSGWIDLRDAAFMGLLLAYAPRIGNAAAMAIDEHLLPSADGGFMVRFTAGMTKSRRLLEYPLDAMCSRWMADYLQHARPQLMSLAPNHPGPARLWLGNEGLPLNNFRAAALFRRRTKDWLGQEYGPHTARKWLRSTAADRSPELAFDAAAVAGHSPTTSLRHYAEATSRHATRRHTGHIARLRRATAGTAERAYADQAKDRG